jgi:DNA polymerase-3 subunit delta
MNKKDSVLGYDEAEERIRRRSFNPVYLFFGEEDFLIEELTHRLVAEALEESTRTFNLDIVYGSDVSGHDILSLVSSFPMMGDRRVILVREFDKVSNKEQLLSYLQNPLATSILALIAVKPDFRTKFFQEMRVHATLVECKQLYDDKISVWITNRVRMLGKSITPDAAELIKACVSRSLREIQNELDKLFIYLGDAQTITSDDVQRLVGMSRQYNVFELQKCLGRRDLPRALEILENMLRNGESPIGMIVMISKYFQKLWLLHDPSNRLVPEVKLAAAIGIYPGFLKEYQLAAHNYSPGQLKYCFIELVKADENLKSSVLDPATAMTLLLYHIVKPT